jgi:hypothetical protein
VLRWLPVACAAVYATAVAVDFHDVITSVYVSSDAALAPVLGEAIGHIPAGSFISLGNHAWYEEWLFLLITRGLPAHRSVWEVAPALWSLAGVALLLWAARMALGTGAALLSGAALLCVGAFGRFCFLAINWHSLSLVHTILLLGASVWLLGRLGAISWPHLVLAALGLGLLSALPTGSDSLFPFWALVPLLAAAVAVAGRLSPRARGRLIVFTAIVLAVAVAGGLVLASVMRDSGITSRALPVGLVAPEMLADNLGLLARSYAFLGGGRLDGPGTSGFHGLLAALSAALVLIALALVLAELVRLALARASLRRMSIERLFYVAFWGSSLLVTSLVFVFSDAPKDVLSARYLLAGYAAVAALLGLVAARGGRARSLVTAAVCAFALIAAYQVIARPFEVITSPEVVVRFPGPRTAGELVRFAAAQHVTRAYGGYWDAEELTWATDFAVAVRPVRVCTSRSHSLCYPQLGMVSSWYRPVGGARSLLIVDSLGTSFNGILAPDPALGRPLASRRLGLIEAYVYPYDIAARIRAPRCGFTWAHPC